MTRLASSFAGFLVAGSATSSIASIEPSPRTSPIAGQRSCQASMRARIVSPIAAERSSEALVVDHVEHGERRGLRDRVADEGAADAAGDGRVHDLGAAEHARERQAVRDRLRDADQVGLDARVLDREEAAGAAEAGLHLVGDEDDAVAVADLAHACDELGRRDDEAALALHRLEDDRGDGLGARPWVVSARSSAASASAAEMPR